MLQPGRRPFNGDELLLKHVTPDPNPGCGHIFVYRGIRCSQSRWVFTALDNLDAATWDEPAERIIEIGTLYGAFTYILADHNISRYANVHTFDIRRQASVEAPGVVYHAGDVFGDQHDVVKHLITAPGRCFVFCDGGYKEREVNTFSAYLKPKDVILCHDYARDPSIVNTAANGFWPGCESQYANIKDALELHGCTPFVEDAAQKAVWGCFIKG